MFTTCLCGTQWGRAVHVETDVFISQELAEQLYLLQFPLRPAGKPYGTSKRSTPDVKSVTIPHLLDVVDVRKPSRQIVLPAVVELACVFVRLHVCCFLH
jgi:hypothetical protein